MKKSRNRTTQTIIIKEPCTCLGDAWDVFVDWFAIAILWVLGLGAVIGVATMLIVGGIGLWNYAHDIKATVAQEFCMGLSGVVLGVAAICGLVGLVCWASDRVTR